MPATSSHPEKREGERPAPKEGIALSDRDTMRVSELLERPPKPTPALLAAARRSLARKQSTRGGARISSWSGARSCG